MIRSLVIGSVLGAALLAEPASAQGRSNASRIPPGHLPQAGMCRVWIDGVPPGRQPRQTDCRTARYQAERLNGRVIYGDDYAQRGNGKGKYKKNDRRDDDRYGRRDDDRRDDRDRRPNTCVDRDRDGTCDYAERRSGTPTTRTPDGRYPTTSRTPTTSGRTGTSIYDAIEAEAERKRRERQP